MTFLLKSPWRYAVLIVLLFAIVAVSSNFIITSIEEQIHDQPIAYALTFAIWALTMGCMFLAGALGLWAIRATVVLESRSRVGRFVDTMNYLMDGVVMLDRKGKVRGWNSVARGLSARPESKETTPFLQEVFPCLSNEDIDQVRDCKRPCEIRRDCVNEGGRRVLRFRSQPSEDMILILISDVTELRVLELRERKVAQLQLMGRIACGVTNDFNNILCSVSMQMDLLKRINLDQDTAKEYMNIILKEIRRGTMLSRQLLELSRTDATGHPTEHLAQNVRDAVELLRVALSTDWMVKTRIEGDYPAVPLSAAQVQQIVVNLALLAADTRQQAGTILIALNKPGQAALLNVGDKFSAVILISIEGAAAEEILATTNFVPSVHDEAGAIDSVVRSLIEEIGGSLEHLTSSSGLCLYRVCLPHLDLDFSVTESAPMEHVNDASLANWQILLADSIHKLDPLQERLRRIGAKIERRDNIATILAYIEATRNIDVMVLDKALLEPESEGLLKAIIKLSPQMGIVALCHDPVSESQFMRSQIVLVPYRASEDRIIQAMLDAKALAASRSPARQA